MHHQDAENRGIAEGSPVRVYNDHGAFILPASLCDDVLPGSVYTHKGFWRHPQKANCNEVTNDIPGDFSGQTAFQSTWVEVEVVTN